MADLLRIGGWDVNPTAGQISRDGEVVRVEARTMRLLVYLAERAGEVVSIEELLKEVWAGVIVTSDSVYQAVAALRRLLGDDSKQPTYIATVPRLGYRLVAKVTTGRVDAEVSTDATEPADPRRQAVRAVLAFGVVLCLAAAFVVRGRFATARSAATPATPATVAPALRAMRKSIAVVPFIDLTKGMSHEYFADGMTEEVIDKLSKDSSLRVAAPTSSFYLKGKQISIPDIAHTLGVAYVLDGSVRKSGGTLRVAARLSRADNGYVVWSETYDRPADDLLKVQDDIAVAVTKALSASIDSV